MVSDTTGEEALELTVMLLVNMPGRLRGSKDTLMVPSAPGATGSRFHSGVVHPHPARTLVSISGAVPVFLKEKTWETLPPRSGIVPKLCEVASNLICAFCAYAAKGSKPNNNKTTFFMPMKFDFVIKTDKSRKKSGKPLEIDE